MLFAAAPVGGITPHLTNIACLSFMGTSMDTVTDQAIFDVVAYGGGALFLIVLMLHQIFHHRKSYLQFIDLASYAIAGLTIGALVYGGSVTFSQKYGEDLVLAGMTNERQPYIPVRNAMSIRYDSLCDRGPETSTDCALMRHFLRETLVDTGADVVVGRFEETLPSDVNLDTLAIIRQYQDAWDLTPRGIDAIIVLFRQLNGWFVAALAFAWMLGIQRRWILWQDALRKQ